MIKIILKYLYDSGKYDHESLINTVSHRFKFVYTERQSGWVTGGYSKRLRYYKCMDCGMPAVFDLNWILECMKKGEPLEYHSFIHSCDEFQKIKELDNDN